MLQHELVDRRTVSGTCELCIERTLLGWVADCLCGERGLLLAKRRSVRNLLLLRLRNIWRRARGRRDVGLASVDPHHGWVSASVSSSPDARAATWPPLPSQARSHGCGRLKAQFTAKPRWARSRRKAPQPTVMLSHATNAEGYGMCVCVQPRLPTSTPRQHRSSHTSPPRAALAPLVPQQSKTGHAEHA